MTRLLPLAELIMGWTAAAAPRDRGVWTRAMRAEFDAISDGGQALGWAAGCLAVAIGWRLWAEAGYVIALVLVSISWPYVMVYGVPVLDRLPFGSWLFWAGLTGNLSVGLLAMALAIYRPDRAILTVFAVTLVTIGTPFLIILPPLVMASIQPQNVQSSWPNVVNAMMMIATILRPGIVGAALGWGISRWMRARRIAA